MNPSTHQTQRSNESLVGTNPASSAAEVNTMANTSTEDDTFDVDEHLVTDENIGSDNLTMDGNNSTDENLSEDENSGAGENPSETDIDADDLESDGNSNSSSSTESHTDDELDHATIRKALEQMIGIVSGNEEANEKSLKDAETITRLKREAEFQTASASAAKRMKNESDRIVKRLEDENLQLRRSLRQNADFDILKADRDTIKEANEHLRHQLDEKEAQLRKEVAEKADYHRTKKERTDYQRHLIQKIKECRDLEKNNVELQRKLDMEAFFSAQAMAMFSKKPEI